MSESPSTANPNGIAIVGMSGRFPGARNVDEFWRNLVAGRDCISRFSAAELEHSLATPAALAQGQQFVRARGVLPDVEQFDAAFFGITPKEAELMDPQHRVFLECAWEALESAGHDPDAYPGPIGVYAGLSLNTYLIYNLVASRRVAANFAGNFQVGEYLTLLGNDKDFLPTRVSFRLNLRGPSMAVQCACSTSLVAVVQACTSLLNYQCDMALAGGVSVSFPQKRDYLYTEDAMVSADGTCRTFDADARGTVFGHGAGVVLLKRLADAQADHDPILAVITGTGLNNDGAGKVGYAAPSVRGQAEAIALAQAAAGVHPDTISYVEAHGTGTPLGDPIEVAALTQAFRTNGATGRGFCAIGSGKTNIGHLDAAAGVVGLIKTVLQLQHGQIPPLVHFQRPNPKIDFATSPFFPVTKLTAWPRAADGTPRRAGVSAFGVGGTNAHVIVEEAPVAATPSVTTDPQVLILSAKSEAALARMTSNLASHFEAHPEVSLADAAFTLQCGRRAFPARRALVANSTAEAVRQLRSDAVREIASGPAPGNEPAIVFLFPGQGSQAVNMGRDLYEREPVFRAAVDECTRILTPHLGTDLRSILYPAPEHVDTAKQRIDQTRYTQPALFTIEYAVAQLWLAWGIKPAAVIGHSIGEFVAGVIAGSLTLADALLLVATRARLIQELPGGAMLAVRLGAAELAPLLPAEVAIAAHNSDRISTVSGPAPAIAALQAQLEARRIAAKPLATSHAFHSAMMDPVIAPFTEVVRTTRRDAPSRRWISTCTGRELQAEDLADPAYFARQLRQPVRFAEAIATATAPHTVFLEVGPGQALTQLVRQIRPADTTVALASLGSDGADTAALRETLGRLWVVGAQPDWRALHGGVARHRVSLPTYQFDRQRYWVEPVAPAGEDQAPAVPGTEPNVLPSSEQTGPARPPTAAAGDTAAAIRALLQRLSGLAVTNDRASFIELGFDSLLLTQVSQAVQTEFGLRMSFRQLLDSYGSVEKLAALVDAQPPRPAVVADPPRPAARATTPATLNLTEEQREIWLGARHSPDASKALNDVVVVRLNGALDPERLQRCVQVLVDRHDALRTTFAADGSTQTIVPARTLALPVEDLSGLGAGEHEVRLRAIADAEDAAPFDLTHGPLFRARLIRLAPAQHVLLFAYHHIAIDGWSSAVLLRELGELYRSTDPITAALEPAMQFSDFVAWQDDPAQREARTRAEKYWLERYASLPAPLELPADRPRPLAKTFRSGKTRLRLDPALVRRVREACARLNCTFFHYLFAVYTTWLHRVTGASDLVVGLPVAGQIAESLRSKPGSRSLVGHCVHFLPVRVSCLGQGAFTSHVAEVQKQLLDARDHEHFTYGSLVKKLSGARDPSRMPLVDVMFNLLPYYEKAFAADGLSARATFHPKAYNIFDLNLYVVADEEFVDLHCEYNLALFDASTVARWEAQWNTLLAATLAAPDATLDRLPILPDRERTLVLEEWNQTAVPYAHECCLHELFEARAAAHPERTAVVFGRASLTYGELDRRANALATVLRGHGVGPDVLVGLCVERSLDLVVAVLGVLKSGGAYVPIDPSYPRDRIAFMVEDSGAPVIVTQRDLAGTLPGSGAVRLLLEEIPPAAAPPPAISAPTNLAYVRYTSGSTGRPKGVQVEHRSVVNFIESMRRMPGLMEHDVLLAVTTLSFDISELELHLPLTTGARVVVVPWEVVASGRALIDAVGAHGVTAMQATPATWRLMIEAGWEGTPGLKILCGGEAMPRDLLEQLLPRGAEVWNMYGPTETTVWSTCCRLFEDTDTSVGRPIANTEIHLLDPQLQPVPIGVAGELFIGGDGVARGYHQRPDLTAERFIAHPFRPGARLYRTGDLARYRSDGFIDCLGRLDSQVKIRGFRIELGEIEALIASHPDIRQAAVAVREANAGDKRLVAYYVTAPGAPEPSLHEHVRGKLPQYMVPAVYVRVAQIPLTPNGKVDRSQLPAPPAEVATVRPRKDPPASPAEQKLAAIWSRVLGLDALGREENFFELGGNSLLAVAVFAEIEKEFGRHLPLALLFNTPTIAGLAGNLGVIEPGTPNWPSLVPIQPAGSKPRFFCVHGAGGNVLLYRSLSLHLGAEYPFYGLQSRGLDGRTTPLTTIPEMAAAYLEEIRRFQPRGPYCLGGYCLGGSIALEIARLLREQEQEVALLALMDTYNFTEAAEIAPFQDLWERLNFHLGSFARLTPREMKAYLAEKVRIAKDGEFTAIFRSDARAKRETEHARASGRVAINRIQALNDHAVRIYRPRPYPGRLQLFTPQKNYRAFPDPEMGWGKIALGGIETIQLPMNPHAMLVEPFVRELAAQLRSKIDRVAQAG